MSSSDASGSSHSSIRHTSRLSTTRSSALPRKTSYTETTHQAVVGTASPSKPLIEELTPLASPTVALFAIWAVHSLTKGRDREKAVFDLYKTVADAAATLKPVVIKAWESDDSSVRAVAIAETMWRLQQIGGYAERVRRQSRRWGWRGVRNPRPLQSGPYPTPEAGTSWHLVKMVRAGISIGWRTAFVWVRHIAAPLGWHLEISLTSAMAELRQTITEDPFDDPDRPADKTKSTEIELTIGGFLQAMDVALFAWMDRGKKVQRL